MAIHLDGQMTEGEFEAIKHQLLRLSDDQIIEYRAFIQTMTLEGMLDECSRCAPQADNGLHVLKLIEAEIASRL